MFFKIIFLVNFPDQNKKLSKLQSGNSRFHSTETGLLYFTDEILKNMDDKRYWNFLKSCSKNNQKLLFVTKVAQKLLEKIKTFFAPMLKYENCTTKVRFVSIFLQFCSVTSVAE